MTVQELLDMLEECDPDMQVKIAFQPNYPLSADAIFTKEANSTDRYGRKGRHLYICANSADEYAPRILYRDDYDEEDY